MIEDVLHKNIKTPSYICIESQLEKNLNILKTVKDESGCKILLSLKAFGMYSTFGMVSEYLDGTSSASYHELTLGKEFFNGEHHIYSPAYIDIGSISNLATHISFNSINELKRYKESVKIINKDIKLALRVNPEISFSPKAIYDPCSKNSRFGVKENELNDSIIDELDGITMHVLCEQDFSSFKRVVEEFCSKFSKYITRLKYINFGGGHNITKDGYDRESLIKLLKKVKDLYGVDVYLEPGSAVALDSGVLVATVLDIVDNSDTKVAILDTSAEAHMPDVLQMPYTPNVYGNNPDGKYKYILAGNSCLSGDIIGNYRFDYELKIGSKVILLDMIHYTMVKNTTFNGLNLPTISILKKEGQLKVIKEFNYNDYKRRL